VQPKSSTVKRLGLKKEKKLDNFFFFLFLFFSKQKNVARKHHHWNPLHNVPEARRSPLAGLATATATKG